MLVPLSRLPGYISFALGMIAALPELLPTPFFALLHPATIWLADWAPAPGRFVDGYDAIADLPLRWRAA